MKNAKSTIKGRRLAYHSPCSQKATAAREADYQNDEIEADRYINYHKFGLPDPPGAKGGSLDRLHADIGNRPARSWWRPELNGRCASTADWDISPHFLFEESFEERKVVGWKEYAANRWTAATNALKPSSAEALPASYTEYFDLSTLVVPYRKSPDRMACVTFDVAVPSTSVETQIMITDADDARWPRTDQSDPQRTWHIRWRATR